MAKEIRIKTVYGCKKTSHEGKHYYKIVEGIECDAQDNEMGVLGYQFLEHRADQMAFNAVAEISQFPCKCEATVSFSLTKDKNGNVLAREHIRDIIVLDTKTTTPAKKSAA